MTLVGLIGLLGLFSSGMAMAADDLAQGFAAPPDSARPRVYWWWLNSHVTRAGITRDLEEMKAKGIRGALVFDAGGEAGPMPAGPKFMGKEWRELLKHAVKEADRLGIEISLNLCSGWDAGGPWVTPEHACQKVVWSETHVVGPADLSKELPRPANGYYRDITVQAFRSIPGQEGSTLRTPPTVTASSSQPPFPPENVVDQTSDSFWVSYGYKEGDAPRKDRPEWLLFEFPEPLSASALVLVPRKAYGPRECQLQASMDGKSFRPVTRFSVADGATTTVTFNETAARFFRLLMTGSYTTFNVQVSKVAFLKTGEKFTVGGTGLKNWRYKAAYDCLGLGSFGILDDEYPGERVDIRSHELIDLSGKMDAAGKLRWDVPPGDWTILRIGHALTGMPVSTSSPGGGGYMLDFLSLKAMDLHWESMAAKVLADVGGLAPKTLKYFHDDSWEVGSPNWTAGFREEFQKRRGYDMLRYLPALAGKIVDGREPTNRFLRDFRQTIGDCIAENHYARFRDLSRRHGMGIHSESGGPFWPFIDAMRCLSMDEIPMGEVWYPDRAHGFSIKQIASTAHGYGKRYCQAETYTSIGPHWQEGPAEIKPIADYAFCLGLTRIVHHTFTCSDPKDGKPGYEYFAGTHFNPNVTWWEQIGPYVDYESRCCHLLSRGLFVADACYYYGDDVPAFAVLRDALRPELSAGYDYDVCNTEILFTRMSVKDGRIVLPDGMSYRLLVLPEKRTMSPAVLKKVAELVEAGATVVGPKPLRAPGLTDYPHSDREVRQLADAVWGGVDGRGLTERKFGKGRVVWGKAVVDVLRGLGAPADFQHAGALQDVQLEYIHRRDGDTEIYFVANRQNCPLKRDCTFRLSGKLPELWDPITGSIRSAGAYHQAGGCTTVPLEFASHGSLFLVFRKPIPADRSGTAKGNFPLLSPVQEIDGPWEVKLDPKWGGLASAAFAKLEDWAKRPEPEIKYYSGTATYREQFELKPGITTSKARLFLDLGTVKNLAHVRLNGRDLGAVWTAPWRVEITDAVHPTGNKLQIDVVNLWPNRLVGDATLPAEMRYTKTNVSFPKDQPLLPSGLLGPVTVQMAEQSLPQ